MEGAKKETRQKEDISSFSTLLQKDTRRFDNEVKKAGIQQARKNLCIFFTRKKKEEKNRLTSLRIVYMRFLLGTKTKLKQVRSSSFSKP